MNEKSNKDPKKSNKRPRKSNKGASKSNTGPRGGEKSNTPDPRAAGRPTRLDGPAFDARELDRLLVYGERSEGRVRYPTYRELANRFDVSVSTIGRYATQHNCLGRRRAVEEGDGEPPEIEAAPAQVEAATQLDAALDAAEAEGIGVERILRLAESWLRQLEEAIDEGRLRPDLADLERLLRVIREAKAEPDERAGIPEGMPTLDDLQRLYAENERRAREETPAMQGRLPHGTIPISWVEANEAQLRAKLAALEAPDGD